MKVRTLASGEHSAAALALADAFQRDDFARWIRPDPDERRIMLGAMFTGLLNDLPPRALVEVTDDLDAAAVWLPPGSDITSPPPPDADDEVVDLFARLHAAEPAQPFWYLMFLGARTPNVGNGSALLRHQPDGPTALWTGSADNVGFYESHGYQALSRHDAPGASAWWMLRQG